jgi:hypothetical protein
MEKYDRSNFHRHTFCVFTEVPLSEVSGIKPNYTSKSGSAYYFTESGVFRSSDHWGRAANCKWRLQSPGKKASSRHRLGFAKWAEFHPDNDSEKLYFIEVDFDNKTVHYQHKSNFNTNGKAIFRTASETEKVIRQIRSLLTTESWARHFPIEINRLRKLIISDLIHSENSLQQIKSALLSK